MADRVQLECTECKQRNYVTYKNKRTRLSVWNLKVLQVL